MFKTTIINTFSSEDECEMFIMVLKQQWPKYKGSVPESTLEIVKDTTCQIECWRFGP